MSNRKAGQKRIKSALAQYTAWRELVSKRIDAISDSGARAYLTKWADDVRERIEAGELGICTQALIASVQRDIKSWESGYFSRVDANGAHVLA